MLITVTAPKKGLGQTVTAINLAAVNNILKGESSIIIDTNKYCRDIEYFLSDSAMTKGLDDFISLCNSNLLDKQSFTACTKRVHEGIDIMASNDCLELDEDIIGNLVGFTKDMYNLTVIDSNSNSNPTAKLLFNQSDVVVVVLNQFKHVAEMAANNILYREYASKIVFVMNKHIEKYSERKIRYTCRDVEFSLKEAGFPESKVFPLAYDADIVNECNDHSVLNFLFTHGIRHRLYNRQLSRLMEHICSRCGSENNATEGKPKNQRKKKILGLF